MSALTDIATAQWRFGRLGELNRIDVRLAAGADRDQVRQEIQALLPPGVHATAIETLEEASAYPSRSYRVNLNVLAMVALFTGGFLVFSAQALEVARRRGEHALLRVLGVRRSGVWRLVLAEAAVLGALGSRRRTGAGICARARRGALRRCGSRRRHVPWRFSSRRGVHLRDSVLFRSGYRCRGAWRAAAGARCRANATGAGAESRRRANPVSARDAALAGPGHPRAGRRAGAAWPDRRAAGVRLCRDRLPAGRRRDAGAAPRAVGLRRAAASRASAAAPRARASCAPRPARPR